MAISNQCLSVVVSQKCNPVPHGLWAPLPLGQNGVAHHVSQMGTCPFHDSVLASPELSLEVSHGQSAPGAARSCIICTGGSAAGEKRLKSMATSVLSGLVHHNTLVWHFTLFGSVTPVSGAACYLEMR